MAAVAEFALAEGATALWLANVMAGSAIDVAIGTYGGERAVPLDLPPCPIVDTKGSFDVYLASRSQNMRTLRRKRLRQLRELGFRFDRLPFDAAALEELLDLQALRASAAGLDVFRDSAHARLLRECEGSRALELARLSTAAGDVAAVLLLIRVRRAIGVYMQGFDPRFAPFSPSYCLFWRVVEDAFGDDTDVVDLLRGDEAYKLRFATAVVPQRRWLVGLSDAPPPALVAWVDSSIE